MFGLKEGEGSLVLKRLDELRGTYPNLTFDDALDRAVLEIRWPRIIDPVAAGGIFQQQMRTDESGAFLTFLQRNASHKPQK